jgi:signal transduction histidine kinase
LRAPIASVLGLNSLAEDTADREELDTVLAMQREALDRLDLYIRDVIDYSRNKRMAVQSEDVCLRKIVDDCMADLVYQTNYNKIDYFIEIEEQTCIQSDKLRIKIIVNNLLSNAIKYADSAKDNSFISIRAEWKEKGVTLIIEDNGIGIKEDYKDKIWDIFFRGTSTIPGSGLGLYILKESVKNLNGEIDFISKEGEGTTFKIFIPEQTV